MVNADRDRYRDAIARCGSLGADERDRMLAEVDATTERPVDAGRPTGAPAPSQAATEAHSDDRHDVTKCSDMRCAICLAFVRGAEIDELRAEVERLILAGRLWAKRAEAAEAKVARVEALMAHLHTDLVYVGDLRAALAGPATEEGA